MEQLLDCERGVAMQDIARSLDFRLGARMHGDRGITVRPLCGERLGIAIASAALIHQRMEIVRQPRNEGVTGLGVSLAGFVAGGQLDAVGRKPRCDQLGPDPIGNAVVIEERHDHGVMLNQRPAEHRSSRRSRL